eukprot:TRINITY_DN6080_c1_g1_i1.p1 TRINITY_DN6080_c1_g1~~TRINITY_DN6080_c1_g1_i1.p1  ORF type:complete len:383 (+),score=32.58 TRINITY_DN6080_c1_g1_i1:72-1220(+)
MDNSISCRSGWEFGEMTVPSWLYSEVYMALAVLGIMTAAAQIATSFHVGMRTLAHRGLQLIAAADMIICLWWLIVARHTVGMSNRGSSNETSWYSDETRCRVIESTRLTVESAAIIWTCLLCVLVFLSSTNFYKFKNVPRRYLKLYAFFFFFIPAVECGIMIWWKAKSSCTEAEHTDGQVELFAEKFLSILFIMCFTVSIGTVGFVYVKFRSKRSGVLPRLLYLPVSMILRGLVPLMTFIGWFHVSCSINWAGAWGIVMPLLPTLNFLVYFARKDVYKILKGDVPKTTDGDESENPYPGGSVASDHTSYLDLPVATQQIHLDLLWGESNQVFLIEKGSRRRHRSSAGSSIYITSDHEGSRIQGSEAMGKSPRSQPSLVSQDV